ncbi:hypothetical protein VDG1235_4235 [Verrucomicrobiia bacterium DG1235]|nr:hypothetical protein VDG1235_4235 [Verrucomicrobiae bacterium DG1235]
MEEISINLILGIVSGIITSFLIFAALQVIQKIVLPWYKDLTYSDLVIDGDWEDVTDGDVEVTQRILHKLDQKGNSITGVTELIDESGSKTMEVTGFVRNGTVVLNFQRKDKQKLGVMTYLLKAVEDGSKLSGHALWYDISSSEIRSIENSLVRKDRSVQKAEPIGAS